MSFTRRKFMKAGVMATAFAAIPLKSALAQIGADNSTSSSRIVEQLGFYNKSTLDPYVNTRFRVYLSPTNTRSLILKEVNDYLALLSEQVGTAISFGDEGFTLLFTMPPGKPFTQDTYLIKHDALGTFYMFVVPVGAQSKESPPDFYEAVIYRRQQSYSWQETIDSRTNTAEVATQQGQNQQQVYRVAPLIVLADRNDSKTTREERDIYRFRPQKLEPADGAVESNLARAKKKAIYPLSLNQAPIINGLKLGMTPDQVLALFPGSKTDKDVRLELDRPQSRFGVSTFTISPEKYSSASKFEGVTQILFTLLDGRVSTLNVGFNGTVFEHVDEFVKKFGEKRNLPAPTDYWQSYVGMDDQLKTLNCKEVEITVFAGGKTLAVNYVQLRDLVALKKYKERRAKAKRESA